MAGVHSGRYTADVEEDLVVFLIGMRFNKPWKVWRWAPVAAAMPRMLRALSADPDLGMIHLEGGLLGRGPVYATYWKSFEHLHRFARDVDLPHLEPWRAFNRKVGASGDVGVWHETYVVGPGRVEAIYSNMPTFGLAAATNHVPAGGRRQRAADRLARVDAEPRLTPA